jgi:hypothetical protein
MPEIDETEAGDNTGKQPALTASIREIRPDNICYMAGMK